MTGIRASTTGRPSGSATSTNLPQVASWVGQKNGDSAPARLGLPGIGIAHYEPEGRGSGFRTSRKYAAFVVAAITAVQDEGASAGVPDNNDDLVLEQERKSEHIDVEPLRIGQARNEQDQAVKPLDAHRVDVMSPSGLVDRLRGRSPNRPA